MTNETKHTPTPYHHTHDDRIVDSAGITVAHTTPIDGACYSQFSERQANAAFIVRACNSHDALVKALGNALKAYCGSTSKWQEMKAVLEAAAGVKVKS